MKKNLVLVPLILLLIHSSPAADSPAKVTSAAETITADQRAQLVARAQQRIKRIDTALASVKWDVPVTPAMKYSDAQRKAEIDFNNWMKKLRNQLQTLRSEIQRAATSKDISASAKMLKDSGQSDTAVRQMIQQSMDQYQRGAQTLSNTSKARHDAVMVVLRNLLG